MGKLTESNQALKKEILIYLELILIEEGYPFINSILNLYNSQLDSNEKLNCLRQKLHELNRGYNLNNLSVKSVEVLLNNVETFTS